MNNKRLVAHEINIIGKRAELFTSKWRRTRMDLLSACTNIVIFSCRIKLQKFVDFNLLKLRKNTTIVVNLCKLHVFRHFGKEFFYFPRN